MTHAHHHTHTSDGEASTRPRRRWPHRPITAHTLTITAAATVAATMGHGGHGDHAAQFRDRFWWSLLLTVPVVAFSDDVRRPVRLHARLRRHRLDLAGARHGRLPLRRLAVPDRRGRASSAARQPGMMLLIAMAITRRVRRVAGRPALGWFDLDFWWELARAGHDHAARPLAGDEGDRPGPGRARRARRAAARRGRTGRDRRRRRDRSPSTSCDAGDVVLVRSGARVPADGDDRRRRGRARRVDDHRRVPAGRRSASATGSSPAPSRPTRRSGSGSTRSATTPRWPASSGSSPRRRRPAPGRRRWPTAPPRCCSTSPPAPALITFVVWCAARRRRPRPSSAPSPCSSSPARTPSAWPSRSSSRSPPRVAARAGILVKDRLALERMRTVDAVLFDKTGTLTKGAPRRHRRRRRRRRRPTTTCCALAARGRGRQRAPARPGDRRRRTRARRDRAGAPTSGRSPAAASRPTVDGAPLRRRRPGPAARARPRRSRPSSPRPIDGVGGARRRGAVRRRATARSSARSRSRTRSGPKPAQAVDELHALGRRAS